MRKFLIWISSIAILLPVCLSSVRAHDKDPEEAKEKAKQESGAKAKPSEVRDGAPKAGSEQKRLTGPKEMFKWKDERGQWHFSDAPPVGVKAQQASGAEKRDAMKPPSSLGRSYMGMKLGEGLESFSAKKNTKERGGDALGMRIFSMGKELWPPGAEDLAVGFLRGSLVSIKVKYSGRHIQTLGGWDALLQETSATYGSPVKTNNKRALWRDNETGLVLVRGGDGGAIATFGEVKSVFNSQDLE